MACKSLANVGNFNPSRCLLCNISSSHSDDVVLDDNRDLTTLKGLSIRRENHQKKSAKMIPTMNS